MEAVKAFNSELSSLYEVKPPISKAKMTALTRGAIKAIKFYKHVVQSVEKFILKCKPEYKVPGLYVIDSIVRQSRHQFGPERDVFAPRFSKNLQQTFVNLFKCPPEDKSKIIRVLNLWQKNQVFSPEAIQPLFDLADPNNPIHQQIQQQQQQQQQNNTVQQTNGAQPQVIKGSPALQRTPTKVNQAAASEAPTPNLNLTEPVLQQLQQLQRLLTKGADAVAARPEVHFDKNLLDFDYDEDEEEVNPSPRPPPSTQLSTDPVASLLTNPEVLRQLQLLAGAVNPPSQDLESDRLKKLQEMKLQEDEFDKHLAQTVPNLPFAAECEFKVTQTSSMIGGLHFIPPQSELPQMNQGFEMPHDNNALFSGQNHATNDVEVITLDHDDSHSEDERYSKRKRSRSRSRDRGRDKDGRRRRSRSRSRSRGRRHRSKSKDRKDKDKREKERETERDKERKKRGLPALKRDNLSVCSTTLWVGHLSKLVHQDDLSNTFGEFGDIVSIDLIVPRGCAFIVMHRRQDAARCLAKLKNYNLHGKAITLAWAPGKGVKGKDLKDYWEGDLGVSYIPWNKLKEDMDLEALEDGGMIDEDSMPEWMKKKIEESTRKITSEPPAFLMGVGEASNQSTVDTSQPPPLPPSNLMQAPMLPMVNPFQLNNRFLGMIPNMPNLANLPLGVPPPNMAPPNMPPSMMPNLGLGLSSPFQGPPSFMPPALPPPQQEAKPAPPTTADVKLRNLSESLMNLAGQPLTLPSQALMSQPPPPLHTSMDDNMDVEMEDAAHPDLNKPPPNIPLSEQLQASINSQAFNRDRRDDSRLSPNRRDNRDGRENRRDRSNERGRRRSRSRDRERDRNERSSGRDRDRRDRDRDFGRGARDRDRDGRDRRGPDRDRGNRWGPLDRRDDRREGVFDRRGGAGPTDRRDGPGRRDGADRRDVSYDRNGGRRDGPDRRESDTRDKGDREKTLNERLKEMAGMKFDESGQIDNRTSPRGKNPLDAKEDTMKEGGLRFEPPANSDTSNLSHLGAVAEHRSPGEARNPSPPDFLSRTGATENSIASDDGGQLPKQNIDAAIVPHDGEKPLEYRNPTLDDDISSGAVDSQQYNHGPEPFGAVGSFGFDGHRPGFDGPPGAFGPGIFGPDGPEQFGPDGPGQFDGPRFRDQGLPFGDDGFGPPPDMMMDGPPGFGPDFGPLGFDGPPDRFMRGGRRGRGRGRGRGGRDGPDFFPHDDFGRPIIDDGFGPPIRDDFGPPMRDDFGPPMRGDDFGPRGMRMRGRGFFARGGPRGRGGEPGPPFPGFNPEFDGGPPEFFRGGPRGRPFGDPFHRGVRGRVFRGGRGRPDFFDGPPPEFFDGPQGPPFEFEGPPGDNPPDFDTRRGRGRKRGRMSRWGANEEGDGPSEDSGLEGTAPGDGNGTPLRDEIDDCSQQIDFVPTQVDGDTNADIPEPEPAAAVEKSEQTAEVPPTEAE